MYRKASQLQINDVYERFKEGIPYSVRIVSDPLIIDGNVIFKALVEGGDSTVEMPSSKYVRLIDDESEHQSHFSNQPYAGYPTGTIVRGISID